MFSSYKHLTLQMHPWREARDVIWCLESQCCHLIPLYYLISCSSAYSHCSVLSFFTTYWPILLIFFQKILQYLLRNRLFGMAHPCGLTSTWWGSCSLCLLIYMNPACPLLFILLLASLCLMDLSTVVHSLNSPDKSLFFRSYFCLSDLFLKVSLIFLFRDRLFFCTAPV